MNLIHVPEHPNRKLGRHIGVRPRHHPRVLPFDAVKLAHPAVRAKLEAPLPTFDYRDALPDNTDALMNDVLGCCTASAKGHRAQQFTSYRGLPALDVDALKRSVVQFYSETTGYDPSAPLDANGQNSTDGGGDMQSIAEFLVDTGFPMPDGTRDKFAFALSIDPTQAADLAFCGQHCQGIDFGIVITTSVMPADGSNPPTIWDVSPNEQQLGGHDVDSVARLPNGNWVVDSWGEWFQMKPAFMAENVELAFAYVAEDMLKDGKTVMGLDLADWQSLIAVHGQAA